MRYWCHVLRPQNAHEVHLPNVSIEAPDLHTFAASNLNSAGLFQ